MNSVSVAFTQDELNVLVNLLDVATKAGGLQTARQALGLLGKIEECIQKGAPAAAPSVDPAEQAPGTA